MATALDQVVDVTITQQTAAIPQPSFSTAIILGTSNRFTGGTLYKVYTDPSQMLGDGFLSTDPEYIRAEELMEQAVVAPQFLVGAVSTSVAQVDTVTVGTVASGDVYTVTIDGKAYSYTANGTDTASTVATALAAAINAGKPNCQAVAASNVVTLTAYNWSIQVSSLTPGADWPGVGFSASVSSTPSGLLTHATTTPNHSQTTDLAAIQALTSQFYGVILCSENWYDIMNMAAYVESQTLLYIATGNDSEILDSNATADVVSILKGKSYKRTGYLYSSGAASGADAALAGGNLPLTPGASTWAFSTLVGISVDNLSPSQINTVIGSAGLPGKNGNVYTSVGGVNVVQQGVAVGGQYLDITVGIDWLKAQIQTNIWSLITQAKEAGSKIPYTDQGVTLLINQVKAAIDLGADNGLIDKISAISVTAPAVLSVTSNQRANRIAPTIKFSCRLAGAFQYVVINGTVSV